MNEGPSKAASFTQSRSHTESSVNTRNQPGPAVQPSITAQHEMHITLEAELRQDVVVICGHLTSQLTSKILFGFCKFQRKKKKNNF